MAKDEQVKRGRAGGIPHLNIGQGEAVRAHTIRLEKPGEIVTCNNERGPDYAYTYFGSCAKT